MFVLMGYIAFESGISLRLYKAAYAWIGRLPAGLALATIAACAAFGAVCGSAVATAATMGVASYPSMKEYKYDPSLATASIAAGSILGIMIPPSIIFIVYGIVTENSIAALFLAGFLPGIMLMLLFMGAIYAQVVRNPSLGPPAPPVGWKTRFTLLGGGVIETLIIFIAVIGALSAGISTPTEAGAVGVFAVLLVALARKQMKWQGYKRALRETTRTTGFCFVSLAGVTILGRFLGVSQIPTELATFASGLDVPNVVIMIGILIIYFIFGCIIDPLMVVLLTIPIFYPLVLSLGYDPIWYGVMMVCVCGTGGITPPVGIMVYVVGGVAKDVPLMTIFRGVWPFVGAMVMGAVLLLAFPQIATFLPNLIMPAGGG